MVRVLRGVTSEQVRDLAYRSHAFVDSKLNADEWVSEVTRVTEILIHGMLPQWPWYKYQRDTIWKDSGGYWGFFMDAMVLVIAYAALSPNDLMAAALVAVKPFSSDLRSIYHNEVGSIPHDIIITLAHDSNPMDNPKFSERALELVALATDEKGKEMMLDVAHGTSKAMAAANAGITPGAVSQRMATARRRDR